MGLPNPLDALALKAAMEPKARIVIELMPNGAVSVKGHIGDKILAYGLLECAKEAVGNSMDAPTSIS